MAWNEMCDSLCPIARSLAVVGDRWTLLILRELALGTHRFDEMQAQTGMSSHLLATRLKRLEQDGVIEKRAYSDKPLRYEYHATPKGRELDPVLASLQSWGLKWGGYAAKDTRPGKLAGAMRAEREAKLAAFQIGKSLVRRA